MGVCRVCVQVCTESHRKNWYCGELANRDQAVKLALCTALYSSVQNKVIY
jgi:hypothetical protein